jgi:hypothetical protein
MKTTFHDLYRAPLTVWVEDPLTHAVLTDLWADTQINVLVTTGKLSVGYMVRSNPTPYPHVYGIIDRDFDADNEREWARPECKILRIPAHELENLLLDFDVLAALSKGDEAAQIRALAHSRAKRMLPWMVCRAVLRDMQRDLGSDFPVDPRVDALGSLFDVERYLEQHPYWPKHAAQLQKWTSGVTRSAELDTWHQLIGAQLDGDEWVTHFSGKEILRHLRSHVRGLDLAPARAPGRTDAERDLDLAKLIARRMRDLRRIPAPISKLRDVLRAKATLV